MERDDLRVPCEHGHYEEHRLGGLSPELVQPHFINISGDTYNCPGGRPVTDAELAELGYVKLADGAQEIWERWAKETGYVKLDGIDGMRRIKMCRQSGERMWGNKCAHSDDDPCEPMYVWLIPGMTDGVLAAIDQEDTSTPDAPLDPKAAARTLREISVLASHGIAVSDLLNHLADRLDNA